jgi:2,4'-dihydroxyacetophenone dioxygenase
MAGHSGRNVAYCALREETMRHVAFEPAQPLDTGGMPWIPTRPGKSFRPLRFAADGWSELMRLEPGSAVALYCHTREVHAFNLAGTREIFGTGERVGPGSYVYEPAGTVDGWGAIGDEPCMVHIKVVGSIEYLGGNGQVIDSVNAETQRALYLAWCRELARTQHSRSSAERRQEGRRT